MRSLGRTGLANYVSSRLERERLVGRQAYQVVKQDGVNGECGLTKGTIHWLAHWGRVEGAGKLGVFRSNQADGGARTVLG